MKKKGVEMSLNVIIVAAIGLLILVILVFLVIKNVNPISTSSETCGVKYQGVCKLSNDCVGGQTYTTADCKDGKMCCKLIG
jgi:hypothetical protein